MVLEEDNTYRTDFIRAIPRQVKSIVVHDDRLICDSDVYIDGQHTQTLKVDYDEITSSLLVD
jgi:hypothetical protein